VIARDFMLALPVGIGMDTPPPDVPPLFELFPTEPGNEVARIMFQPRDAAPAETVFSPGVMESALDGLSGRIRCATGDYQHEGVAWRHGCTRSRGRSARRW